MLVGNSLKMIPVFKRYKKIGLGTNPKVREKGFTAS